VTRSPRHHLTWLTAMALLVSACVGGTAAEPEADDTADHGARPAAEDHGDHGTAGHTDHDPEEHAGHDAEEHAGHGAASAGGLRSMTTEETLARLAAMDPARLAALHDHGEVHDHRGRGVRHPDGIDPHRVVIPAIDVDADVIDLGLQPDGSMEVPADFAQTGWFTPGPRPGRVGPSVIAGHVDSRSGPAVFFRLTELSPGDLIEVHSEHGEVVTFAVRELEQHPKDAFPTDRVYGPTSGPELRLITCGGDFDTDVRSYRDNVIVYAERLDP
jgi:hypothetical protein